MDLFSGNSLFRYINLVVIQYSAHINFSDLVAPKMYMFLFVCESCQI